MRLLFVFTLFLISLSSYADCRGCCSHHGGVTCVEGVTQCRDGSALSSKCSAKGCNKCEGKSDLHKPHAKNDKYDRSLYRHWIDEDGDCQNTRHEVLISTSLVEPKFKTAKKCIVISGKWLDPYSGKFIYDARKVDIDHIVPLKAAHTLGAKKWDKKKREQFANDPTNLIPVSASLNRQKGSKGPTKWMPPNQKYQCDYVSKWSSLTKKYQLQLAEEPTAESEIRTKLDSCNKPKRLPASSVNPTKQTKDNTESQNQN